MVSNNNIEFNTFVAQFTLKGWNQTQTNYPRNNCIHEVFEQQVAQAPSALAAVFEEQELTYQELNQKANQLASYLRDLGVKPDGLVGIYVERSIEMLVGILGILKAGGAYVPLDPNARSEQLSFVLKDTQVSVLLTQQRLLDLLPAHQAQVICLDRDWAHIEQRTPENLNSSTTANHLAYVMYTSGSTGRPKGVCITHRGVVRLVKGIHYANLTADEVFLQLAPISFDASTFEIWGCLLNGAKLIVFPVHAPSLEELGAVIQRYKITTLWLTSGLFHLIVDTRLEDFKPVRQLLAGGDTLSVPHVQKFLSKLPDCKLINGYGPTENTTFTCCYSITEFSPLNHSVPIGRPIGNTQAYILDSQQQPVPIGVMGELYIGGDGLARGYLNCPDSTQEKFIPNPFSSELGARLYKTGDLGRYLPDGNIEFLGRVDHQVKIRGFRIELGEIESCLVQHPGVNQTVVIVREDIPADKRLVAYVVPQPEQPPQNSELRRFLEQKLPKYMVPAAFVLLDKFPLTLNGKVDRRALPAPDIRAKLEETFISPSNEWEIRLAKIWGEVLDIYPVGIQDDFFELGGHSLLAARLINEIEKELGKKLPLEALFQAPTVEQLAKIFDQSGWSSPWFSLVPIQPSGSHPPFFGIHSLGKGQEHYRNIARHLGSDQPIYGLDYWLATRQTKDRKKLPNTWSVEELAAHYIKEMQILQPEGPYFLAGLSFAGIVAYKMAQQLVTQDQEVALLVLFDTACPALSVKSLNFNSLQIHLRNLSQLEMKEKLAYIMMKVKHKIQHYLRLIKPFLRKVAEKFYLKFKLPMPYALHYSLIVEANQKLASDYALQVYPGKVTLFRANDQAVRYDQLSDLGWSDLAVGGVEIHQVPGDHMGMFQEPHVQTLAEKLRACIDKALQNVSEDHSSEPKKSTTKVEH